MLRLSLSGDTFDDCLKEVLEYTDEHKMNFIDPFDNVNTIAGQGTIAAEILDQAEEENIDIDLLCCYRRRRFNFRCRHLF